MLIIQYTVGICLAFYRILHDPQVLSRFVKKIEDALADSYKRVNKEESSTDEKSEYKNSRNNSLVM